MCFDFLWMGKNFLIFFGNQEIFLGIGKSILIFFGNPKKYHKIFMNKHAFVEIIYKINIYLLI